MWCRKCAQDVPGVPSLEEGKYSCARCSGPLDSISVHTTPHCEVKRLNAPALLAARHITRRNTTAGRLRNNCGTPSASSGRRCSARKIHNAPAKGVTFRLDAGHAAPAPHAKKTRRPTRRIDRAVAAEEPPRSTSLGDRVVAFVVWSALSFGTMAVVCGLALLGWSSHTGRQELWGISPPIILGARSPWCSALYCNWTAFGQQPPRGRTAANGRQADSRPENDHFAAKHHARPIDRLLHPLGRRRGPRYPLERSQEPVGLAGRQACQRVGRLGENRLLCVLRLHQLPPAC